MSIARAWMRRISEALMLVAVVALLVHASLPSAADLPESGHRHGLHRTDGLGARNLASAPVDPLDRDHGTLPCKSGCCGSACPAAIPGSAAPAPLPLEKALILVPVQDPRPDGFDPSGLSRPPKVRTAI